MRTVNKEAAERFLLVEARRQIKFLRERFDLPRTYAPHISWTWWPSCSEGGWDAEGRLFIRICLFDIRNIIGTSEDVSYEEYEHIADNAQIGNCTVNWKKYIACLISHELAHTLALDPDPWILYLGGHLPYRLLIDCEVPHGKLWKAIYRTLRVGCVSSTEYAVWPFCKSSDITRVRVKVPGGYGYEYSVGEKKYHFYRQSRSSVIFRCDPTWKRRRKTTFVSFGAVRRFLLTAN